MRRPNREVNIFNMSLLDILCGALGAFCFMMLALFPSYLSAQKNGGGDAEERLKKAEEDARQAQQRATQAHDEQSLAYFKVIWTTADDVDLSIRRPDGQFLVVKKDLRPGQDPKLGSIDDVQKGPGFETVWFADVARPGAVWEMDAELHDAAAQGVPVRGIIVGRSFDDKNNSIMGQYEFGPVVLTERGRRVPIARLQFDRAGQQFSVAAAGPSPGQQ